MAKRKRRLKKSVKRFLYLFIGIVVLICAFSNKNKSVSQLVDKVENITLKQEEMFNTDKLYMALDSTLILDADKIEISNDVLSIDDKTIHANKVGTSKIKVIKDKKYDELEIVVTDIITNYQINNKNKLICEQYSSEDEKLLEDILANQIEFYGTKTRAGVVAAARFLSLEFEYKLNYFYENGRMTNNNQFDYCDGEGRYLHKGLYLSSNDYKDIKQSRSGPQMWGCPMYEETRKMNQNNGLDCSGFVTWAMYNAGYDIPDYGAGDLFDLGEKVYFTDDYAFEKVKVGDLVGKNGHVGILVGINDNKYYIAESLDYDLHMLVYSKDELKNSELKFFVLMDDYYKEDGILTNFWN